MYIFAPASDLSKETRNILVCKKRTLSNSLSLNKDDVDDILDSIIEKMIVQNNLLSFWSSVEFSRIATTQDTESVMHARNKFDARASSKRNSPTSRWKLIL